VNLVVIALYLHSRLHKLNTEHVSLQHLQQLFHCVFSRYRNSSLIVIARLYVSRRLY